jgi:replication-associated recombination protein RarA
MSRSADYKAWFEKYRPRVLDDVVFPDEKIKTTIEKFYNEGFIKGNILSYGPGGYGKTSLSEVLIHRIIKGPNAFAALYDIQQEIRKKN